MPKFTQKDFPKNSLHSYLFLNENFFMEGVNTTLTITYNKQFNVYSFSNSLIEINNNKLEKILMPSISVNISAQAAFFTAVSNKPMEDNQHLAPITINDVFTLNDNQTAVIVKPEYQKLYDKFQREAEAVKPKPFYTRALNTVENSVLNAGKYVYNVFTSLIALVKSAFSWVGTKLFGNKKSDNTVKPSNTSTTDTNNIPSCCQGSTKASDVAGLHVANQHEVAKTSCNTPTTNNQTEQDAPKKCAKAGCR